MEEVLPPQPWLGAGHRQHSNAELDPHHADVTVVVVLRHGAVVGRTTAMCYRRKALAGAVNSARLVAGHVC